MEAGVILHQNEKTGFFTEARTADGDRIGDLQGVHDPSECDGRGCAIHNHPSDHALKDAPLNWRLDRGILERICPHGVGHPDADAAVFLKEQGHPEENVHGCDWCCS